MTSLLSETSLKEGLHSTEFKSANKIAESREEGLAPIENKSEELIEQLQKVTSLLPRVCARIYFSFATIFANQIFFVPFSQT